MEETNASKWAPAEIDFKKLDDLPKGKPHTPDAVIKAMKALHQMIHAQAKAYGGKDSKLLPVGIAEDAPTFKAYLKLLEKASSSF